MERVPLSLALFVIAGIILVSASLFLYGLQEEQVDIVLSDYHVRGSLPVQVTYTIANERAQGQLYRLSIIDETTKDVANFDGVIEYSTQLHFLDVAATQEGFITIIPDGNHHTYLVRVVSQQGIVLNSKQLQVLP